MARVKNPEVFYGLRTITFLKSYLLLSDKRFWEESLAHVEGVRQRTEENDDRLKLPF